VRALGLLLQHHIASSLFLRFSAVVARVLSHFGYCCRDTCSSHGSTASIKSFLGATWHFSLYDEAVCKDFVDSVRLGILACLSRNLGSKEESSSSALFQAQQTSDVHTPRVDADVRYSADEFATISLGRVAGGNLPTRSPESITASFSLEYIFCCAALSKVPMCSCLLLFLTRLSHRR